MKRTPPPRSAVAPSKECFDSESHFSVAQDSDSSSNVSARTKRKRGNDYADELNTFKNDIKKMFMSFQKEQEDKIMAFLNTIKEQNTAVQKSIDFLSEKYDHLINKIDKLEAERKENMLHILTMERKLEKLERYNCSTSLELRNIPKKAAESKEDLVHIILKAVQHLKLDITHSDIKDLYRITTRSENKPIVVDFTSVLTRDRFIDTIKKYNSVHKNDKFNTKNVQIDGPNRPIYISESLTSNTRTLFLTARKYAKANNYMFCWTSHGRVNLRKIEGAPLIRIDSVTDLEKLKQK